MSTAPKSSRTRKSIDFITALHTEDEPVDASTAPPDASSNRRGHAAPAELRGAAKSVYGPHTSSQQETQALNVRIRYLTARVEELEGELAQRNTAASDAHAAAELEQARGEIARLQSLQQDGGLNAEFLLLNPADIVDPLPPDRLPDAFTDKAFRELADDIRERGQETPIVVRRKPLEKGQEGAFELASGRRRLAACRAIGIQVLARVRDMSDEDMVMTQWAENEQRSNISPIERARWFALLTTNRKLTSARIGDMFKIDRTSVTHYISLADLPPDFIDAFQDRRGISFRGWRTMRRLYEQDPASLERAKAALNDLHEAMAGRPLTGAREMAAAIRAAGTPPVPRQSSGGSDKMPTRYIRSAKGKIAQMTSSQTGEVVLRFEKTISAEVLNRLADRLPQLLEDLRSPAASD
jgi:ParB family chromosome partitioning protein